MKWPCESAVALLGSSTPLGVNGIFQDRLGGLVEQASNTHNASPMPRPRNHQRCERGQAAVETAITMPLTIFLVLGTLQLFQMLQGRLFAEHAAFKAVRTGVVRHGDCHAMTHAAIVALLPSFSSYLGSATPGNTPDEKLASAFRLRTVGKPFDNGFDAIADEPYDGSIVWLYRESPRLADVTPDAEDDFDDLDGPGYRLEVHLVYWYPLKVPFANWVMSSMFRAYFGLGDYTGVNPLMPTQRSRWTSSGQHALDSFSTEFERRYQAQQYSFPITASYVMRMMTPPRPEFFRRQNCEPAP